MHQIDAALCYLRFTEARDSMALTALSTTNRRSNDEVAATRAGKD